MSIATIEDLVAVINDRLIAAGVEADRGTVTTVVQRHRTERYEDHGEAALDALFALVWDDLTEGAERPC